MKSPPTAKGPPADCIDLPEVMRLTQLSKPTIYRYMKLRQFPRPALQRPANRGKKSYWSLSAINSWLGARTVADYSKRRRGRLGRPSGQLADPNGYRFSKVQPPHDVEP